MKNVFLFIAVIATSFLNAQNLTDALRYSDQNIKGTARYRAMSGAFGSLGGDLSAIQINPAGSSVFLNSYGSLTLSSMRTGNDVFYGNDITVNDSRHLNFNQIGAVLIYDQQDELKKGINKISFSILYDQTNDFRNYFNAIGESSSSIDRLFLQAANGLPVQEISVNEGETISGVYANLGETRGIDAQNAFLGYETFILEPNSDNADETAYSSNLAEGSFLQDYIHESSGIGGKLTFNGGLQFNDNFYLGANINSHFINYDRVVDYFEENSNNGSEIREINYVNRLSADGAGLSAQIGAITKIGDAFRLGLAFETPTWYVIQEEGTQFIETVNSDNESFAVDPGIINLYPEYELRTPGSITASAAILFGKSGLISVDYSYKDYTDIKFDADQDNIFAAQNLAIENNLQAASTLRLGGEYRIGNWSYRAGYRYQQSPYKNEVIMGDLSGLSFGMGWDFRKLRFDVAYDTSFRDRSEAFYPNTSFQNAAGIDTYVDQWTFTLGLNL